MLLLLENVHGNSLSNQQKHLQTPIDGGAARRPARAVPSLFPTLYTPPALRRIHLPALASRALTLSCAVFADRCTAHAAVVSAVVVVVACCTHLICLSPASAAVASSTASTSTNCNLLHQPLSTTTLSTMAEPRTTRTSKSSTSASKSSTSASKSSSSASKTTSASKSTSKSKSKSSKSDDSKVHKLALKGSSKIVNEFVSLYHHTYTTTSNQTRLTIYHRSLSTPSTPFCKTCQGPDRPLDCCLRSRSFQRGVYPAEDFTA